MQLLGHLPRIRVMKLLYERLSSATSSGVDQQNDYCLSVGFGCVDEA